MNIIYSKELGSNPHTLGAEHSRLDIYDGLDTPVSHDVIVLTEEHVLDIEEYARRSAANYGDNNGSPEPTLAHSMFGLPSLVVRVDCTINNNQVVPYEMEDSPSGQGITHVLHKEVTGDDFGAKIRNHYQENLGILPVVVVSEHRSHGTDDAIVLGDSNYVFGQTGVLPDEVPVIVKAIPGVPESHREYLHLQDRAVAPLKTEGDKNYAVINGDLTPITDAGELLRDSSEELISQVLKTKLGSMAMGVSIFLDSKDRKIYGKRGIVSGSRLERDVESYSKHSGALIQPFAPPIQLDNPEGRNNAILRVFVLLSNEDGDIKARAIGGCYVARSELIVHGASNAVGGIVTIE